MTDTPESLAQILIALRDGQTAAISAAVIRQIAVSMLNMIPVFIAAAGNNQATATVLTASINVITGGGAGTGVIVPLGYGLTMNRSSQVIRLYPIGGSQIEAQGANNPYLLGQGQDAITVFNPLTPTQGYLTSALNVAGLPTSLPATDKIIWRQGGVIVVS
jgi:hypothetical protein